MNMIQKLGTVAVTLFCFSFPASASLNRLYDQLQDARSKVFLTDSEHKESMAKALSVIIGCEMDELCAMIALKHISTNEDNLLYIHFYNGLLKQRDDILFNTMHCQSPELNQARKVMASCLVTLNRRLTESLDAQSQIKAEKALKNCTLSRLSKLANENNVFAQAKMMEFELGKSNPKGIEHWYNKMQPMIATRQYHVYSECSDKF